VVLFLFAVCARCNGRFLSYNRIFVNLPRFLLFLHVGFSCEAGFANGLSWLFKNQFIALAPSRLGTRGIAK
jgi:hypothetical protein